MITKKLLNLFVIISIAVFLSNCATVPTRNPLPEKFGETAQIPDIPRAKFWGDAAPSFAEAVYGQSREKLMQDFPAIFGREHNYLALSGGGSKGAFGAGMLVGWSAAGTRPEFTMVTGISTGAIMAPFVFLGPAYDGQLKEMYTAYSTKDLVIKRSVLSALTGSSVVETTPMQNMLTKYVDQQTIEAIAAEYKILPIAGVSINSLIRTQGIGDMYRTYLDCQRDGLEYNLAYLPEDFDLKPNEDFDPVYMGKLFDLGYQLARNGYPWDKAPPGFE